MADKANITSIHALERFRSALIKYVEKGKATVDEVTSEVQRTKFWLQYDQTTYWRGEHKRRGLFWQEKQQELFSAEISQFSDSSTVQRWAAQEAKRSVDEAEEKVRTVKDWGRRYESIVLPVSKKVDKLSNILDNDMTKAIRFLNEAIKALSAYAEVGFNDPAAGGKRPPSKESSAGESDASGTTESQSDGETGA
jgi:hypothetical protein